LGSPGRGINAFPACEAVGAAHSEGGLEVVIVPGVLYMAYRAFGTGPAVGKRD